MNFAKHLIRIGAWTVATKNAIKGALVDNGIKSAVFKLKLTHVALLVNERGVLFFVELLHGLDDRETDVNVRNVLEAIVEHFFGNSCITKILGQLRRFEKAKASIYSQLNWKFHIKE